ncbi:MAG TPA: hypothetical protein VF490_05000 [Chryseosolibacter sp.]
MKSSLDNYILPGTMTGTEILWLYMVQWKRELTAITFATFYLMSSQLEAHKLEGVIAGDTEK